jgi:hypothetical protein
MCGPANHNQSSARLSNTTSPTSSRIDPQNHLHILLTFHEACLPPHSTTCIVESKDGGGSLEIHDGKAGWNGGEGQVIFFLDSPTTWLWGSQTNGFWRTPDSGRTWKRSPA